MPAFSGWRSLIWSQKNVLPLYSCYKINSKICIKDKPVIVGEGHLGVLERVVELLLHLTSQTLKVLAALKLFWNFYFLCFRIIIKFSTSHSPLDCLLDQSGVRDPPVEKQGTKQSSLTGCATPFWADWSLSMSNRESKEEGTGVIKEGRENAWMSNST